MKIKVLHITKMKGISGSENHLSTLLAGLDKQQFEVHLCILSEARHIPLLLDYHKQLEQAHVSVVIVVIRKYLDVLVVWKLRTYILREHFDIVHTHLIHADFYGTLAAKLAGTATIISSRHNDDRFRHYHVLIWLNRFLARWHDKIIVISDWIGRFLQDVEGIPAEKIVRIHYGLEPETVVVHADPSYIRREFHLPEHVPILGTIGRLTEQKGHPYFLQAIAQITPSFPELQVFIVGAGEWRTKLERQARELGIETNVIFTGYRNDALKLLSGFDIFMFPSLWEGFGLVLLEAMALKKPIVASNVSAIPESVIDGTTGILVPPGNVGELAKAMKTLLINHALRNSMAEAGYLHLKHSFSTSTMIHAVEMLYKEEIRG